ncbi:MAG TPA: hypothetical protein VF263_24380, partial [Longimicrobiaceae bacterium]
MIDYEALDKQYETHMQATGFPPQDGIFDRRWLYPLARLPLMVQLESGETLPEWRIPEITAAGWLNPLPLGNEAESEFGYPAYIPTRIGLFLQLEQEGYDAAELRALAAYEEHLVEDVLTSDDQSYLDSDQEVLIRYFQSRLEGDECVTAFYEDHPPQTAEEQELWTREKREIAERRALLLRDLSVVENADWEGMSRARRHELGRIAYRIRQSEDVTRLFMIETTRSKIRQGYSPCIHFRNSEGWIGREFIFEDVVWSASLYDAWVPEG